MQCGRHIVELKLPAHVLQREPRPQRCLQPPVTSRPALAARGAQAAHLSTERRLAEQQHVDAARQLQRFKQLTANIVSDKA